MKRFIDMLNIGEFHAFLKDWKWIVSYSQKYKWAIVFYTITGILSSTFGLGSAVISKYMIDIIINRRTDQIYLLAFLMVFSALFGIIFSAFLKQMAVKINVYVNNDIKADIFDKIMDADWLKLSEYNNGDLLNRFTENINSVAYHAVSWLPNFLIQMYTFIIIFVIICYYDITLALLAFFSAPFLLVSSKYIFKKMQAYETKVLEVKSELMDFETESFYNYDTIKSFGAVNLYQNKLEEKQEKLAGRIIKFQGFSIQAQTWISILTAMVGFISFGYCLYRVWGGMITFGTMTLFLQQRNKLSASFSGIVKVFPDMVKASVAAQRVREIAEIPKEMHNSQIAEEFGKFTEKGLSVKIKDVDFAYTTDKKIFANSNFSARPNEIVALVGASGEGKTTFLRMILGLLCPESGEVVLVGHDGREISVNADLRYLLAYVPQGNTLFSGTIAENLRLAKENATDQELIDALKVACAWEFVEKLEDGIYQKLRNQGRGLSEGQAQRIAIARAVLRNAPILILDEATSALDEQTERKVLDNIKKLCPNKTCIITTHRSSVLTMCQRVYKVTDNKIVEQDIENL